MNRNDYMTLSGADYIRAMFANTRAEDGALTLENDPEDSDTWYMDWSEADAEKIAAEYETLQAALYRLAKDCNCWECSAEEIPEDLQETWNTYLLPYPHHGLDDELIFNISMKHESGEPVTEEEQALWCRYIAGQEKNALTRLPLDRCNPTRLIQRARRYAKLLSLNAPQIIVDIEAQYMAEELALYRGLLEFG